MTLSICSAREERRGQRSDDVTTALSYQLAWTRGEAGLEALVLVDDQGCVIARAGAPLTCEELAAYAPLLVKPNAESKSAFDAELAALAREVRVDKVAVDGAEALLCSRGGNAMSASLLVRAIAGCQRILNAAT
jgi:hypothetical protein